VTTPASEAGGGRFTLADLKSLAEEFASDHLSEYVKHIKADSRALGRKEINDALWGTTTIFPIEVLLIDSPLIQRLRSIRQLGVVHWVYPGAVHTRFEHTLGVLHQVQYLVSAINGLAAYRGDPRPVIDASHTQLLRIAALLHDVGHSAFSHVIEKALDDLPGVASLKKEFSQEQGKIEDKQLSEIFAFYVIRSLSMWELVSELLDRHGGSIQFSGSREENVNRVIEKLSLAVIGQQIDDRLPLLHQLISGPFDADKLDYFVRDARLAGTPSVLDVSRLVQKLSVRELESRELPGDIGKGVKKIDYKHCIFGLKWSGIAMLDELHLARILLFAKIYRHPKVLAIEHMLRGAVITLAKISSVGDVFRLMYTCGDDVLLASGREELIAALQLSGKRNDVSVGERLDVALSILDDIRMRRLAVKAFEIESRYAGDPLGEDKAQKDGLTDFREVIEHPEKRAKFHEELVAEVERILAAKSSQRKYTHAELEAMISVHAVGALPGATEIGRAMLLPISANPLQFRDYTVNRGAWADSYMYSQPAGFVFAPPDIADSVYIAVERQLRTRYGVRLPTTAIEASKRNPKQIQDMKQALSQTQYYRDAPFDIRPLPDRLTMADVEERIHRIAQKIQSYQEPQLGVPDLSKVSTEDRIFRWLRQFDDNNFIDCALVILEKLRMIGRLDTVAGLRAFVGKYPAFRGGLAIPFGSAKDSGAIHTYFTADVLGECISQCVSLDEAVRQKSSLPLIFIDDFVGSGGQGQDILGAGFGVRELRKELGEQRELFGSETQEFLRQSKIGFSFTAAWDIGVREVQAATERLGLDATVFKYLSESDIPFAFDAIPSDISKEVWGAFKNRCAEIGLALITYDLNKRGREFSMIPDQRKLGYGNRAMLLASPFNVPAQTLTAIWASGSIGSVYWQSLMTRRRKDA
jgi:deoxynucleoside triphosphate triphosphohydrolase SAMHD1